MNTVPTMTWASLLPALPEMYLAAGICVLLLADVFFGDRYRRLAPTLTLVILVIGAFITAQYGNVSERVLLFADSYVADPLAVFLKLFAFTVIAVALLYSREYLERRGMMRGEYYVLSLTALLGVFVMVSANSLLTVYIGVELLALSLYAMVAFDRDSGIAAESAMKYFVLGAIASGMIPGRRGCVQVRRRAVPHVAARRLHRRAHRHDVVPVDRAARGLLLARVPVVSPRYGQRR